MRFLQIEWHNHERARNAWDIERAEMKAKIAKQEGDCRSAKKLNDSLDRQIRMLERALKAERAKNKATAAGEDLPTEEEVKREWNGRIGMRLNANKGQTRQPHVTGQNAHDVIQVLASTRPMAELKSKNLPRPRRKRKETSQNCSFRNASKN